MRVAVPQRLEERIGKAERDQVLDGFLAQIVIDAENAALSEMLGNRAVDLVARLEALADRLFDDDAIGRQ